MIFQSAITYKGNSSFSFNSQEEADRRAYVLDCNGCVDCTNCIKCINCTNCKECINCTNCKECTDCIACSDCTYCTNCARCTDCKLVNQTNEEN